MPDPIDPVAFRRLLSRAVAAPVVLLAALALVFVGQIFYLLATARAEDKADQVIARGNALLKLLIDGETGMRGYALTGDPVFLEPYREEEQLDEQSFDEITALVADRPDQVARLEAIRRDHDDWQVYAKGIIALKRDGGDYLGPIRRYEGKRRMDSLRTQIGEFIAVEQGIRDGYGRTTSRATVAVVAVTTALAAVLGLLFARLTRSLLRRVADSYQAALSEAEAGAAELERRVEERTWQLQESLNNVKQLQGLLPICAWCKKVRDDKNYWHTVENYISARTDAEFTHGICPPCGKKMESDICKLKAT